MKALSIIGIVLGAVCLLFVLVFATEVDWQAGIFFGFLAALYLLVYAIVGTVVFFKKQ